MPGVKARGSAIKSMLMCVLGNYKVQSTGVAIGEILKLETTDAVSAAVVTVETDCNLSIEHFGSCKTLASVSADTLTTTINGCKMAGGDALPSSSAGVAADTLLQCINLKMNDVATPDDPLLSHTFL